MGKVQDLDAEFDNELESKTTDKMSRTFPLTVAVVAILYNALVAVLCTYLPRDSMVVGYGAAGYALIGCVVSTVGAIGILTRRSTLVYLFSYFLILDTIVASLTRFLLLELLFKTTHSQDACSNILGSVWVDQQEPTHAMVTSAHWQQDLTAVGGWCTFALNAVHVVAVGVLLCTSAAQVTVALAVRGYGRDIRWHTEAHGIVEYIEDVEKSS